MYLSALAAKAKGNVMNYMVCVCLIRGAHNFLLYFKVIYVHIVFCLQTPLE